MGLLTASKTYDAHPEHPLRLTQVNRPFICEGCKDVGIGCCYQCNDQTCARTFHEECARPQEIITHPFSKGCVFTFFRTSHSPQQSTFYKMCDACGTHISGFFYACHSHGRYGHFIHPSCMTLKNRLTLNGLELVLTGTATRKCDLCGHKNAFEGIKGWSFVSQDVGLSLHIKCVKDMILENWKKIYLPRKYLNGSSSSSNTNTPIGITMESNTIPRVSSGSFIDNTNIGKGSQLVVYRGKGTSFVKTKPDKLKKLMKLALMGIGYCSLRIRKLSCATSR